MEFGTDMLHSNEMRNIEAMDSFSNMPECPVSREECLNKWDSIYNDITGAGNVVSSVHDVNTKKQVMSCSEAKNDLTKYTQEMTGSIETPELNHSSDYEKDMRGLLNDGYDPDAQSIKSYFGPSVLDKMEEKFNELKPYVPKQERIMHTPVSYWSGERGNSKCWVNNNNAEQHLRANGLENIAYKNGVPDFSPFAVAEVKIENMNSERDGILGNFSQAFEKIADQFHTTPNVIRKWAKTNGYTIHECPDKRTCQLVPSAINSVYTHVGGVSECKRRDL